MSPGDKESERCPIGEASCVRLDELHQARMQISELSEQVHVDSLTGLYNYRHFLQLAEQELERTRRNSQPTALIMVDLDHFKRVNDDWGHEAGNQTLRRCASLIKNELRKIDIPCRYGGEEFALLLPATELPHAVAVANRLRLVIQQSPIEFGDQRFSVTASMGVDVSRKGEDLTPGEFVERADAFLYQAKIGGRNRVCHPDYAAVRPKGQVGREEKDELLRP
ncbi:MAG: GGDEF domain-containing protein [Chromatiaceae bacterium]|nr:GGDEF domain-containing protein [Gammaproteobacteria bacterium]MCP5427137.1 GGDEF domain-containing protein [Chromatiaceae bacterium]MCB1862410.1 GGDEF domain-containing protein [Gammaproteobacteria bacterium]MCB1871105.1 GGDEF domain-containing protein [Gammaproteobacteria bacterium]MCB1879944.1 GGDEF domain-containing protein [Gammaproteobacteria bacterium]